MKKSTFSIQIKNYYFSPALLPTLMVLLLFLLLIKLGVWQIHRGDEKKRIQIAFTQRSQTTPINLNQSHTIHLDQNYSPSVMKGYFDNQHSFLLDNKLYQHHIGYEVFTPFLLKNSASTILVNRGWLPQDLSRKKLPKITPIEAETTIQGLIVFPNKTFSFKQLPETGWPQRIQTIHPEFLKQYHFKPFIVVINKKAPYSFIPNWQPITLQASRHYAYAFQWFTLSLTLLIAFFSVNTHHLCKLKKN